MINLGITSFMGAKQVLCKVGGVSFISRLPASRIAILATKRSVESYPVITKIVENKKRFEARLFTPKWDGEPKLSGIKENLKEIFEFKPDWIVAIGGGSVMDGAKIVWALYENPTFDLERLSIPFTLPKLRIKARFVAIPTTSGSGSEASSVAVLTSEDGVSKIPVVTHDFLPDVSILDVNLLENIPMSILVPSMLDALSHSIEGFVSKLQNQMATNLVDYSVENILSAFRLLVHNQNDEDAKVKAQIGAYYSGIIQNLNVVGPAHALAHNMPFVPHGVATGLLLRAVVKHFSKNEELANRYNKLARKLGFDEIFNLFHEIYDDILPKLGIDTKISSFVKCEDIDFDKYAKLAIEDNLYRFFPIEVKKKELVNILKECW